MNKPFIMALACCLFMAGCKDNEVDPKMFNPSQPVVFTDFSPKEGAVRTRMYITGSNFGSDVSKIHINIGGQEAKTIGSNGTKIYCMVPKRAYDGNVSVRIEGENGETVADYTFEDTFEYQPNVVVGTLLRKVDEDNNSAFQDGSFDGEGSCPSNDWMVFDPKAEPGQKRLFTSNHNDGLRMLDLTNREVYRLFPRTQYSTMESFTFTADGDTLLFPDDNWTDFGTSNANIYYALRSESFRKIRTYNYGPGSYSVVAMDDGSIFYSTYRQGAVRKLIRNNDNIPNRDDNAEVCFTLSELAQIDGIHIKLVLHPSKKYMYVFSRDNGAILRSDYNSTTKKFEKPRIIAGGINDWGCQEGTGTSARFNSPWAGVFVKNSKYVAANKDELYDFYFTDRNSHCIWKLTPEGVATIVAGRSNYTVDGKYHGYIDGDPLREVRFNQPTGLAYDEDAETFYIGDNENKALRYMSFE